MRATHHSYGDSPHFHSAQLVSAVGTRPLLLVYSGNFRSERSVTHNKGYRTSDHPSRGNIMAPAISIAVMCSSHWVHVDDNKVVFPTVPPLQWTPLFVFAPRQNQTFQSHIKQMKKESIHKLPCQLDSLYPNVWQRIVKICTLPHPWGGRERERERVR